LAVAKVAAPSGRITHPPPRDDDRGLDFPRDLFISRPVDSPQSDSTQWFTVELAPHEPALRAYLHGLVGPSDIDDIVQETYARLLRARERGPVEHPRGLLFATARNAARDLFRRRATANTIPITEMVESRVFDSAPNAAETASRQQETDLLATAIAELPPRCREILVLRKFENLSHREIAEKLGISVHTVEVQLTKALHRCEEFFARHGLP
jgi:RNA polymerase sigma-70 factor (ECF subfamily)